MLLGFMRQSKYILCYAKSGSKTQLYLFLREEVILIAVSYNNVENTAIDI